jgi:putative effector of murein hydrolase
VVTTLIAMVVTGKVGGTPSLTAALVISTGVFRAVTAR